MRKLLRTLLITTALGAMPVTDVQAQDVQDTLGRVLQGLQGGQDQRPAPEGYRDDGRRGGDRYRDADRRGDERGYRDGDRRYDERDTGRRGMQDGDDRRRSTGEAERRLDEQQRRLDEERRRLNRDRR
jgi:hypothetical protein